MPQYTVKILLDLEAADDLDVKSKCKTLLQQSIPDLKEHLREIVVRDMDTRKSLKISADGQPLGPWQKG